ncbi:MAG: hypothetical protein ACPIOQ_49755 [Promethearchaeia archaeon]
MLLCHWISVIMRAGAGRTCLQHAALALRSEPKRYHSTRAQSAWPAKEEAQERGACEIGGIWIFWLVRRREEKAGRLGVGEPGSCLTEVTEVRWN